MDVSVVVNEINFFDEDVKIDVKKDGADYDVTANWKKDNSKKDTYIGAFSFADEGEYTVQISYQDRSLNKKYTSEKYRFIIKTTVPTVEWSYDDKIDDGNDLYQVAVVTVTDKYFIPENIIVAGAYDDESAGKDINGNTLYKNAEYLQSLLRKRESWTHRIKRIKTSILQ